MIKVLMVCLGNICRSPMADGLLRKKVEQEQLNVLVDSAGTSALHVGEKPDRRMREIAKRLNTPIDGLRARQFVGSDFEEFDWIYVMDESNCQNVLQLARTDRDRAKVKLILNEVKPEQNIPVPDPYYGGDDGFIHVYELLDEATDEILKKLKQQLNG